LQNLYGKNNSEKEKINMAKVVILSGAGISAESGISTFRDSDGLWEEYDIREICTAGCLETNRSMTILSQVFL